jgi:hypothetical protein
MRGSMSESKKDQMASIGLVRDPADQAKNMLMFDAVLMAVKQFVHDNPSMLEGEGDFVVVFGPRDKIQVHG